MTTSLIANLIDALVTTMTAALPGVLVYDGVGVSGDRNPNALFIGVDDPDSPNVALSAHAEQDWANANYTRRDENGFVVCAASSWTGEVDPKLARNNAMSTMAAVETALRANPSLNLTGMLWTSVGTKISLLQNQTEHGAHAVVLFRVNYRARI